MQISAKEKEIVEQILRKLDLAIITETPLSLAIYADLAEGFSESDLVWKVDIVDSALTSEDFRKIIQQDYVILQNAV